MPITTRRDTIRLTMKQKGTQVTVEPENEDRFVLSMEAAVAACKAYDYKNAFNNQFRCLLGDPLFKWIRDNKNKVKEACVTVTEGGLLFLIVRKQVGYDPDLTDSLTDLDISIAQNKDFNHIQMDVLALPACSRDGFASFFGEERWEYSNADS